VWVGSPNPEEEMAGLLLVLGFPGLGTLLNTFNILLDGVPKLVSPLPPAKRRVGEINISLLAPLAKTLN
jgi:hypothetical protein